MAKHIDIIATIGPATWTEEGIRALKDKGVDFVRVNMSHSTTKDLQRTIRLAKKVGIPYMVDTEGSQVRTGYLKVSRVEMVAGESVRIYQKAIKGDAERINLTPASVVAKLSPGDLLYCDFESLVLRVSDVDTLAKKGYITARVISGGSLGNNKGVFVHTGSGESIELPTLTPKDLESIKIGLAEGVGHIAASFMRSGDAVREVRRATKGKMKIISKVECIEGLQNLDGIIDESDALLVDRGDLSKEIFLYRIPFTQKIIVHRARRKNKPVVVATNFLESMVHSRLPTRAEIHDIESSITDGAAGLTLAAETAIGKYPAACVTVMRNVINHANSAIDIDAYASKEERLVQYLEQQNYLLDFTKHSPLIAPHGGQLVQRFYPEQLAKVPKGMPSLSLTAEQEMDVEQLALGAFSPLEGFMTKAEVVGVLADMRLPSGAAWPLPIVLAVSTQEADAHKVGSKVLLKDRTNKPLGILHLAEKYTLDKKDYAKKLYGTLDETHPGVRAVLAMGEVFLAGKVDLLRRRDSDTSAFELTPAQTRRLFESLGWSKIIGFHTRNVIHRGHEHIQMQGLEQSGADGLFVHPVVGKKKSGDFEAEYIAATYDLMSREFYPKNKVIVAAWPSYSRYAGPREALFTALVRQNYGCSHFIVGRDHTGVGTFYGATASHKIFDAFKDVGIVPVRFTNVFYSKKLRRHVHESDVAAHKDSDKLHISGTQARKILESGKQLPPWFMRKEISQIVLDALKKGKKVFVD